MSECHLYLVHCRGTDYYKIGISDSPPMRLASLQSSCPLKLDILMTCWFNDRSSALEAEQDCHLSLQQYRMHGEWFEFGLEVASSVKKNMLDVCS